VDDRDTVESQLGGGIARDIENFGAAARGTNQLAVLLDQPFQRHARRRSDGASLIRLLALCIFNANER
jgi:hypothetical protein